MRSQPLFLVITLSGVAGIACVAGACGTSNTDGGIGSAGAAGSAGSASPDCPTLSGTWSIAAHCVPSFVGEPVTITQDGCALSMAEPFDGFTGTVARDGALEVSGPSESGTQECSGVSTADNIGLACPGPCAVQLSR